MASTASSIVLMKRVQSSIPKRRNAMNDLSSFLSAPSPRLCVERSRRRFLADLGMGFAGLAMGAMLARDGIARAGEIGTPQRAFASPPKAKSVIWIFLVGGMSHME